MLIEHVIFYCAIAVLLYVCVHVYKYMCVHIHVPISHTIKPYNCSTCTCKYIYMYLHHITCAWL